MPRPLFIAYATPDRPIAQKLFDALAPDAFLDAACLLPGDWWDDVIPKAQASSQVTVALISAKSDQAFYLRNELATAIELSRKGGHKLVPVYLDATPPPYGLARVQSLRLAELGSIEALAGAIRAVLGGSAAPQPTPGVSEADRRMRLYDDLCRLLSSQFDEIIFRLGLPDEHIAPRAEVRARRAMDVILVVQQRGPEMMARLLAEVRRAMGA